MHFVKDSMRKVLLSSLLTLLFIFALNFIVGLGSEIAHSPAGWDGALMIGLVATGIGAIALLFWGIPMHLYFSHNNMNSVFWYLLVGLVPGILLVFVFHLFGDDKLADKLIQASILASIGGLSAIVFWFFVRTKNA